MSFSPYFKRSEFECKCGCGFSAVDAELLKVLTGVREAYGPLVITSGCRCSEHNANVGGASGSKHVLGLAADFRPLRSDPEFNTKLKFIHEMLLARYPDRYGIASKEGSFVHLDVFPGQARRWEY